MPDYTFAITGQDLSGPAWKTFVDNVKTANQQVADLKKPSEEAGNKIDSLSKAVELLKTRLSGMGDAGEAIGGVLEKAEKIGSAVGTFAKVGAVVGVVAFAAKAVYDYVDSLEKAAAALAKLASANGLTTDQVQALQDLAKRSGKTFEEVTADFKDNKLALDTLTQTYMATGQAMDYHVTAKAAEMARQAKEAEDRFDAAKDKLGAFIAQVTVPLKATILEEAAGFMERLNKAIDGSNLDKLRALLMLASGLPGAIASSVAGAAADPVAQAEAKVKGLETEYDKLIAQASKEMRPGNPGSVMPRMDESGMYLDQAAKVSVRLQQARAELEAERRKTWGGQGYGGPDPMGMVDPVTMKPTTVVATGGGGGGGRTDDDYLEAQIKRYEALGVAATSALGAINTARGKSIEDMTREVNVQRQIDEIVGKLGAKYDQASQAQKDRLRTAVSGAEGQRAAVEKLTQANVRADATERQYGDGQLVLLTGTRQLNDERDTGRLSVESYDNALKVLGQTTEDLRLKNIGLQGGLPALAAGWENARNQANRANTMFAVGGKIYGQVMDTMTMATNSWGQSFDQILLNAGVSWAKFLANMALQAAASPVLSAIGGGLSSLGSLLFGSSANAGGFATVGSGAGMTNGVPNFTGMAGGGQIDAGKAAIVGEFEPELWMPKTGGNILNRQQLQALGVGEGGGDGDIHLHFGTMNFGEFVSPAQMRQQVREVYRAATEDAQKLLIGRRRRGVREVKGAFV